LQDNVHKELSTCKTTLGPREVSLDMACSYVMNKGQFVNGNVV